LEALDQRVEATHMMTRRGLLTGAAALTAAWMLPEWEPRKKLWALGGMPDVWDTTTWIEFPGATIASLTTDQGALRIALTDGAVYRITAFKGPIAQVRPSATHPQGAEFRGQLARIEYRYERQQPVMFPPTIIYQERP
jgi:hypothetical protein